MENIFLQPQLLLWLLPLLLVLISGYLISIYKAKIALLQKELAETKEALQYSLLQLESSRTELKNSLAFRERAISIVVHDLKSPLAFLYRIISHLHQSHASLPGADLSKLTSEMSHTTYQIVGFVNDLLDWLNSNQISFSLQSDIRLLNDFLRAKCAVYQEIAEKKGLRFELKAKPDFHLRADFNLLQIVIRNLLDNAIKHTEQGGITIHGSADEAYQYIVVSDTGIGINTDKAVELEHGVITKKTNESTQIGFRIVHDMVAKMNGKIRIRQAAGGTGTEITVILPK